MQAQLISGLYFLTLLQIGKCNYYSIDHRGTMATRVAHATMTDVTRFNENGNNIIKIKVSCC